MRYSHCMHKYIANSLLFCLAIASVLTLQSQSAIATKASPPSKCDVDLTRLPEIEANNANVACAIVIDQDLIFPRNIVTHDGDIWLVDKGSNLFVNGQKSGAIYRYRSNGDGYDRKRILSNLDDPNDIAIRQHNDGSHWVYFTSRSTVQRFEITSFTAPNTKEQLTTETVLEQLPTHGWHKLVAITLTANNLYLTMPSLTDHCEVEGLSGLVEYPCGEEALNTATIRSYRFKGDRLDASYTVIARGLRDALATQITVDQQHLIAADNGWDQINLSDTKANYNDTPQDEINIIPLNQSGSVLGFAEGSVLGSARHYGWPYCYDINSITPPFTRFIESCAAYAKPTILLPAHSAPLGMTYFNGRLLVNLHGNNDSGAKTVAFTLDESGLPFSEPELKINWAYQKDEGQWLGRPKGLATLSNSELLVTDDWNHQLFKIVFAEPAAP